MELVEDISKQSQASRWHRNARIGELGGTTENTGINIEDRVTSLFLQSGAQDTEHVCLSGSTSPVEDLIVSIVQLRKYSNIDKRLKEFTEFLLTLRPLQYPGDSPKELWVL